MIYSKTYSGSKMKRPIKFGALYGTPVLILCSILLLTSCKETKKEEKKEAKNLTEEQKRLPENALAGLKASNDLEVTLFASEPMLSNPTNMDVDSKGRVWICEGYNYRMELNPDNPTKSEGDRILILEDTDGDGKADNTKVFYQGNDVNAALGISVLGNKVIVSCSPNVFIFTDTNGDDKPDSKEILYTGIEGEQHDHAMHAFTFGPDGKLYFNFGNAGEQLKDKNGKPLVDKYGNEINDKGTPYRQGMVFRSNLDGSELEVLGHNFRNNYEVAVDSYGSLWQSDNDDDGNKGVRINYVMEFGNYGYTDEMTGAGWRSRRTNMEDSIPLRHWHLNDPGVVPNLLQTGAGSPTGMVVYEGDLLPKTYHNQVIHCDAGPNVVRAYPVEKDGAGFKAKIENILEGTEDQWFRPSDVTVAPDGSIFVADWYDPGVGGHQAGDLARGRIFRVAPAGKEYKVSKPDLESPEGAAEALKSPNIATRYLAWQKLHSLGVKAEPALQELYKSDNSRFRARALWLLSKLEGKGAGYVSEALKDKDEDIRITAIRAARELNIDIIPIVKQLANDNSPQIRREALIALRGSKSSEAPALWAELAEKYDGKDRWYLEALGISAYKNEEAFFQAWASKVGENWKTGKGKDIVWRSRAKQALPLLAQLITDSNTDIREGKRYFRAFDFQTDPSKQDVLISLLDGTHPNQSQITTLTLVTLDGDKAAKNPKVQKALNKTLSEIKGTQEFVDLIRKYKLKNKNNELLEVALGKADEGIRVDATRLLLENNGTDLLKRTLKKDENSAEQLINALGGFEDTRGKDILQAVAFDQAYGLGVRKLAMRKLGNGWSGEDRLLRLARDKKIPSELEASAAGVLSNSYRKHIRDSAALFLKMPQVNGGKDLPPVAKLASLKGNAASGKAVFKTSCGICHKVNGEGINFGPDLSEIGNKLAKEGLYNAILNPDAGISFGYEGYIFKTKEGNEFAGYIASQTEDEIEIKMVGGTSNKYKKSDIVSKKMMDGSLMPSNLQAGMSQDDLVNLVEYLSSLQKADKKVASK